MKSGRATWFVAIALAIVFAGALSSARGPSVPKTITAKDFSATSAYAALREVLGSNTPHPIGSAAQRAVRDRIIAHLRSLGYLVQIQQAFTCDAYNTCGNVTNIIARRAGDPAQPGIVVSAHYDSVPAGPGASDDGQGVATILEIARIIRLEPFRNPPILLIDDGEEAGLLGAEAFAGDPGLKNATLAVINVEARGTNGPSSLFETSRNNRWLVANAIPVQPRPETSSLFATIYDILPNDTDLSVFKRTGLQGLNFGIIGNVAAYHTPLDNLENVDLRSLQHQGINSLAILRKLGNSDVGTSTGNSVWFDALNLFVVRWPQGATIWIAIASLIALIVATLLLKRERARPREIAGGLLAFIVAIIVAAALAFVVTWIARLRADQAVWLAHPNAIITAMWILGALATLAVFSVFERRERSEPLQFGAAFGWHVIAIALAVALPGVSFLFLAPAVALSLWALFRAFGVGFAGDIAIPAAVAAIILFPLGLLFHDALGAPSLPVIAVLIALVATTFAPMLPRLSMAAGVACAIAIVACIVASLALPPYDAENPRRINVNYVADEKAARWTINRATPELQLAAPFRADAEVSPWSRTPVQSAPATMSALPMVQVAAIRKDAFIRWTIHSPRGAPRVAIYFSGEPTSIQINGVTPPPRTRGPLPLAKGWNRAVVRGADAIIEVKMTRGAPVTYIAADYTYDSPPAAAPLLAARNASTAVPSDDGDMTITRQRGSI